MTNRAYLGQMKKRLSELDREIAALQDAERDATAQIRERSELWLQARELECGLCGCGGWHANHR